MTVFDDIMNDFMQRHTNGELTRIVGSYAAFKPNWDEYHTFCMKEGYPIYDFQKYIKETIGSKVTKLILVAYAHNFKKLGIEIVRIQKKITQDIAQREARMRKRYWIDMIRTLTRILVDFKNKGDEDPIDTDDLLPYTH